MAGRECLGGPIYVCQATIERDAGRPIWRQLYDILRDMIESGEIPPGKLLPSQRTLMQRYDVSDGTVKHAMALLREEGLVETEKGRGVYVKNVPGKLSSA